MGYLLVDAKVLKEKGLKHFETLPDGRGIVDFSLLRVLGSMSNVEVVSTSKEVFSMIDEERSSGLYDKPEPDPLFPETGAEEIIDPNMNYDGNGEVTEGTTQDETMPDVPNNGHQPIPEEGDLAGDSAGEVVPDATEDQLPTIENTQEGAAVEENAAAPDDLTNETEGGMK